MNLIEQKGKDLLKWLSKPRIVFARTTPAHKLLIVSACQQQGHIVAVTGDGVNDSPAIKKADIGIAMGITGTDVAKDAADMILLSDDFSAIVLGVQEGRKIFDNLKRAIIYILASNFPELLAFLSLVILRIPLPLTTIMILCVDLGFNIIPSISFGSENPELDVLVRPPRKKNEHLMTKRVLVASYFTNGVIEAVGAFLTYFVVMNDFGLKPSELFGLAVNVGFRPGQNDIYDPNLPYYGQTSQRFIDYCQACWNGDGECNVNDLNSRDVDTTPDWIYPKDNTMDLRLYYLQCTRDGQIISRVDWEPCKVKQISLNSDLPVCYTTEMGRFAQTGFYLSMALLQFPVIMVLKTRKLSSKYAGLDNFALNCSMGWILMFTLVVCYIPPLSDALGTRGVIFMHYGLPALPFVIFIHLLDEFKKYMIRNARKPVDKPNWFERNAMW